jgi:transposase InsO family protein
VFIRDNKHLYTIEMMCRVLEVSRSSYHCWVSGKNVKRENHKQEMEKQIQDIYFEHKQRYGSPRIAAELRSRGVSASRQTVAKYMKNMNLKSKRTGKYVATTDSRHNHRVFENILEQRFNEPVLAGAWVSDITYIQTMEGFLYQTVVIDLEDRKIIGWSHSDKLTAEETTLPAFMMAVQNRPPQKELIFHSDRGVQYCCNSFVNLAAKYGVIQSMSRKGNCWDGTTLLQSRISRP